VTSAWRVDEDWPRAGQLARAALADAQFPAELAPEYGGWDLGLQGRQQAEAGRYLDQALSLALCQPVQAGVRWWTWPSNMGRAGGAAGRTPMPRD
jgi:hypothetical protein